MSMDAVDVWNLGLHLQLAYMDIHMYVYPYKIEYPTGHGPRRSNYSYTL